MKRQTSPPNGKELADQIVESSKKKRERSSTPIDPSRLIPTGSTLLNCACSDTPHGGFALGKIVNLIGDSSAGKTFLALTTLAEVANIRKFREYHLVVDDAERALEFDMNYLFGRRASKRIKPPALDDDGDPLYSKTVEDFQANLLNLIKAGLPFIYVLDSLDSLPTEEELKKAYLKAIQQAKDEEERKAIKDYFQGRKAALISALLREMRDELPKLDSSLIIISQVRDLIGGPSFGPRKTRSGGRALKFYSTHEMWMIIEKTLKKKTRSIGVHANINVKKNKLTGKQRRSPIIIYYDYGIDDIGANVDFLVKEKHWGKRKNTIIADDFNLEGTRSVLVEHIEEKGIEKELSELVGQVWLEIEEELRLGRKQKYR